MVTRHILGIGILWIAKICTEPPALPGQHLLQKVLNIRSLQIWGCLTCTPSTDVFEYPGISFPVYKIG